MATKKRSGRKTPGRRPAGQRPPVSHRGDTTRVREVLVGVDGSKASIAAVRFARAMEDAGAWKPQAITVTEHLPVAVADVMLPIPVATVDAAQAELPTREARRILKKNGAGSWELRSEVGSAPVVIVDFAKRHAAELIVLGLGRHGKLARLFGAETVARVIRRTNVPVLAIDEHTNGRPDSIVVAMDFGPSSVRAAREALDLLEPGGRLHLVHVRFAVDGRPLGDANYERTYAVGVEQGFAKLLPALVRDGVKVTTEFMLGGVLECVLKAIKQQKADVIALGSHSRDVVDRLVLGSTPAAVLRAVKCSVLIGSPAPPPA